MANQFLIAGGDGLWSSAGNWSTTSGGASNGTHPVAGDVVAFTSLSGNANITVDVASACASLVMSGTYAGTLTFNSTLTLTSTCTFLSTCTIAGTAGTLISSGTATFTSGGKTLTCGFTISSTNTVTLADNWTVNGLFLFSAGGTLNQTTAQKISCAGGFRCSSGSSSGSAKIEITGGTWDTPGGNNSNNIDLAGNVTVSGTVSCLGVTGKTLKYVSGTITTTGSTIQTSTTSTTFDTAGVTWNSINFVNATTIALTSALAWSGTLTFGSASTTTITGAALSGTGTVSVGSSTNLTLNNTGGLVTTGTLTLPNSASTFAGSAGFTVGTLTTATLTASRIHTLTFGNTYAVTTALGNVGTSSTIRQALKSSSAGNKVVFNLSIGATNTLTFCDPTDINSSAAATVVSVGGTITTTLNWTGSVVAGGGGGATPVLGCPFIRGVAA